MIDDAQASTSIWMATANTPSQSRLKENIRTDVCIIGAGIAGLSTAYLLGREGQGMTHGTIAGMLLTDLIQGRKNQWEDLYNPSRIRVKSLPEYASENINVARQYADYVTAGDITSESELKPGEGAIMRDGVSKVAVHRDHNGNVHKLSAVCPHLGCIVAWNSTEQTWDCPCHGSRFSAEGRVYQGPANSNLPSANES